MQDLPPAHAGMPLGSHVIALTVDTRFECPTAHVPCCRIPKVGIEDCADTYGEKRLPLLFNAVQRSAVGEWTARARPPCKYGEILPCVLGGLKRCRLRLSVQLLYP